MADFDTSVRYLKGVGEQRAILLEKIGIRTLFDLVYYFPRRYEDRKKITPVAGTVPGQPATICATVLTSGSKSGWRGRQIFTAALSDDTGLIYATFFNQAYLKDVLVPGCRVLLSGRPSIYQGEKTMIHPVFEVLKEGPGRPTEAGRIVALYRPPEGLSQRAFHLVMLSALRELEPELKKLEVVPFAERQRLNLGYLSHALNNIHFPSSETNLRKAREYLIFEEFFLLAAALRKRRLASQGVNAGPALESPAGNDPAAFLSDFQALLTFPLTESQRRALAEIGADLEKGYPMHRLLTGEVGSGKTLVAAGAIFRTVRSGGQAALLAPTEILAEQHFMTLQRLFARAGWEVGLLVNGLEAAEKARVAEKLAGGEIPVVVGTHGLLSERLKFRRLALAVIDEEHKFGVNQREELEEKGREVNLLLMSATPIPRTLALTLYGDIEVSSLSPRLSRQVATYLFNRLEREAAYRLFDRYIRSGQTGYLVASRLKDGDDSFGAEHIYRDALGLYPHWKPALLHGRLPLAEKRRVVDGFRAGEFQVLVATSVIEVGIDLPEASLLLIDDAERFGLAQLHQMRGRIGRQAQEALCLVIGDAGAPESFERLQLFAQTAEGEELAAEDLVLRGEGEVLGERQHGLPSLRIADLRRDLELLKTAREIAFRLLDGDPELTGHQQLRERLARQGLWEN